jgi:hypothetical protein
MKAQILKIAGVKSEKEFYKKYPSEEAFMKKHGKAFKKAQIGAVISGGDRSSNPKMIGLKDFYDDADLTVTGMNDEMRQKQAAAKAAAAKAAGSQPAGAGGSGGLSSIFGMLGGGEGGEGGGTEGGGIESIMGMFGGSGGGARYGADIPKTARVGANMNNWWANMTTNTTTLAPGVDSNEYGSFPPPVDSSLEGSPGYKEQQSNTASPTPTNTGGGGGSGFDKAMGSISKYTGPAGKLYEGYKELRAERRLRKAAAQEKVVSDITLKASQTRPEEIKRKYVRPEDIENTGEEFFPIYGVGTNVLARNGMRLQGGGMIGGNPTEIQNTYGDGNSIYDDLGYEPLINYDQQKDFRQGGYIPSMQKGGTTGWQNWQNSMAGKGSGFSGAGASGGTPWGAIGSQATATGQSAMGGQNAGGKIGGTVGKSIGSIWGPAGGAIGEFVGGIAGNALDTNAKRTKKYQSATKRNITNMGLSSGFQSVNAGYSSYVRNGGNIPSYEDGGYMNPEYNPQVIAMFGDHNADDFADYANKFRAGGHLREYTPPSERAMETYEDGGEITSYGMGGQLKTHWGGEAETMSYNPYLPGSGETVVFRGQSHTDSDGKGNTGIGITYGDSPVEVERGEPMFEMQAGGEVDPMTGEPENTGVVFGNMQIDKKIAGQIDDPELMEIANKYHGKKFKNVGIDLSKQEAKQNKIIDKSSNELDSFQVNTAFDKLKLSALKANLEGANLKLKGIADTKIALANYQNAINDTKEELSDSFGKNLSAEHLAKGLIKIDKDPVTKDAKWGSNIAKKAKDGVTTTKETTVAPKKTKEQLLAEGYTKRSDGTWRKVNKGVKKPDRETRSASAMDNIPKQSVDKDTGLYGGVTPAQFEEFKKKNDWYDWSKFDPKSADSVNDFAIKFNAKAAEIGSKARILEDKDEKGNPTGKTTKIGKQYTSGILAGEKKSEPAPEEELIAVEDVPDVIGESKSRFPWEIPVNRALDYLRPTDQEALDMAQLYPEMYAMSSNQLEPVPTQGYQPDLGVPYDISFQDQLNANQADYRAMQRVAGYNPAAQANLNAQKYQANQKVLGEQFRANQAMKDQVYGENRDILNKAKLTNLGIYDKQYERQAQALSNTKATTQAALNSISDKYARNKLENRKLSIYENMYNYRFGKNGRAQNWNGLQFFDTDIYGAKSRKDQEIPEGYKATSYDANGNPTRLQRITEKEDKDVEADMEALEAVGKTPGFGDGKKNGGSVKKNYKNSSVVKAYKNL